MTLEELLSAHRSPAPGGGVVSDRAVLEKGGPSALAELQSQAEPSGFHRGLRAWVDESSEVARVLRHLSTSSAIVREAAR